jgi:hypothetical protein
MSFKKYFIEQVSADIDISFLENGYLLKEFQIFNQFKKKNTPTKFEQEVDSFKPILENIKNSTDLEKAVSVYVQWLNALKQRVQGSIPTSVSAPVPSAPAGAPAGGGATPPTGQDDDFNNYATILFYLGFQVQEPSSIAQTKAEIKALTDLRNNLFNYIKKRRGVAKNVPYQLSTNPDPQEQLQNTQQAMVQKIKEAEAKFKQVSNELKQLNDKLKNYPNELKAIIQNGVKLIEQELTDLDASNSNSEISKMKASLQQNIAPTSGDLNNVSPNTQNMETSKNTFFLKYVQPKVSAMQNGILKLRKLRTGSFESPRIEKSKKMMGDLSKALGGKWEDMKADTLNKMADVQGNPLSAGLKLMQFGKSMYDKTKGINSTGAFGQKNKKQGQFGNNQQNKKKFFK